MVRLAAEFDLGFVGETGQTENHRIMLSNKQFTYLLAGVPALLTDIPSHLAFASEAEGAVQIYERENPRSLALALDSFLLNPERLAASRKRAFCLGQTRFNWDIEQDRLIQLVEKSCG
jgi:glycosyltransferase involved in cell wall biosynthesis